MLIATAEEESADDPGRQPASTKLVFPVESTKAIQYVHYLPLYFIYPITTVKGVEELWILLLWYMCN